MTTNVMRHAPHQRSVYDYDQEPLPSTTLTWMRRLGIVVGIFVWAAVCQASAQAQERQIAQIRDGCVPYSAQAGGYSSLTVMGRCK